MAIKFTFRAPSVTVKQPKKRSFGEPSAKEIEAMRKSWKLLAPDKAKPLYLR
jgi:hypothetical protein